VEVPRNCWLEHRERALFTLVHEGLRSSIYKFTVQTKSKVWIAAHQQDTRESNANNYIDLGLAVFSSDKTTILKKQASIVERETILELDLEFGLT
jgi:hypothetical protein